MVEAGTNWPKCASIITIAARYVVHDTSELGSSVVALTVANTANLCKGRKNKMNVRFED